MTQTTLTTTTASATEAPPLSRSIQRGVGVSLVLAGLLNGGLQYVDHLAAGDGERRELIAWGLEHHAVYQAVWFGAMVSSLFLLIGFLGLAQLTRWHAPRLTVAATLLIGVGDVGLRQRARRHLRRAGRHGRRVRPRRRGHG